MFNRCLIHDLQFCPWCHDDIQFPVNRDHTLRFGIIEHDNIEKVGLVFCEKQPGSQEVEVASVDTIGTLDELRVFLEGEESRRCEIHHKEFCPTCHSDIRVLHSEDFEIKIGIGFLGSSETGDDINPGLATQVLVNNKKIHGYFDEVGPMGEFDIPSNEWP